MVDASMAAARAPGVQPFQWKIFEVHAHFVRKGLGDVFVKHWSFHPAIRAICRDSIETGFG
jgi:hypothetical protein